MSRMSEYAILNMNTLLLICGAKCLVLPPVVKQGNTEYPLHYSLRQSVRDTKYIVDLVCVMTILPSDHTIPRRTIKQNRVLNKLHNPSREQWCLSKHF